MLLVIIFIIFVVCILGELPGWRAKDLVHGRLHIYEDCQQAPPSTRTWGSPSPAPVVSPPSHWWWRRRSPWRSWRYGWREVNNKSLLGVEIHYSCMCVFLPAGQIQHHRHFVVRLWQWMLFCQLVLSQSQYTWYPYLLGRIGWHSLLVSSLIISNTRTLHSDWWRGTGWRRRSLPAWWRTLPPYWLPACCVFASQVSRRSLGRSVCPAEPISWLFKVQICLEMT